MAGRSPNTPASLIPTSKKTGNSMFTSSIPQGIGYSPSPLNNTPMPATGSGIPSFRSLRSLLPFGPNKSTPNSSFVTSPNTKSPFSGFARKSIQKDRERIASLSNDALRPIIAIERPTVEETPVRRSVSFSELERPSADSGYALRTPSPGPPLSLDLSTIMEADNSGVSKNLPSLPLTPSSPVTPRRVQPNTSALDLSTTHVADQVRSAMLASDLSVKQWCNADKDVAVVIDADDIQGGGGADADTSFNLDNADPALVALLSPNSFPAKTTLVKSSPTPPPPPPLPSSPATPPSGTRLPRSLQASSFLPRLRGPSNSSRNITTITPATPTATSKPSPAKGKTPFIANRSDDSSPQHGSPRLLTPSTAPVPVPSSSRISSLSRSAKMFTPLTPNNPRSLSTSQMGALVGGNKDNVTTTTLNDEGNTSTFLPSSRGGGGPARTLRRVVLGITGYHPNSTDTSPTSPSTLLGRASLDLHRSPASSEIGLRRPSLDIPRRNNSFDSRRRPTSPSFPGRGRTELRSSSSPVDHPDHRTATPIGDSSLEIPLDDPYSPPHRPSLEEASMTRPSLDSTHTVTTATTISRPSSSAARLLERERQRTPSSRMLDSPTPSFVEGGLGPGSGSGPWVGRRSKTPVLGNSRSNTNTARTRKRSMSVQERLGRSNNNRLLLQNLENHPRPGSSLSVGRVSRRGGHGVGESEFGVLGGGGGDGADGARGAGGGGPKLEWLGPRTVKAFRAAGLLDHHHPPEREKKIEGNDSPDHRFRDRSGSGSGGVLTPSPLGGGSGGGSINRFASLRGSSDYNNNNNNNNPSSSTRAHSRMPFSDTMGGGGGSGRVTPRRGSESVSVSAYSSSCGGGNGHGLMDSPTLTNTGSSGSRGGGGGDRDTPRSAVSTAPTSLSESFGYFGRDRDIQNRDRERERDSEIRQLKDKHATEVAALLGALSDSQRTVRLLRDENSELRERSGVLLGENDELRRVCADLRHDCEDLRRELSVRTTTTTSLRPPGLAPSWSGSSSTTAASSTGGFRTVVIPKPATSSPLATDVTPRYAQEAEQQEDEDEEDEEYNNTIIIHDSIDNDRRLIESDDDDDEKENRSPLDGLLPSSTSTPSISRRLSNTSSIFPAPPANMTMLLHDDGDDDYEYDEEELALMSNRSSVDPRYAHHHRHHSSSSKPKPIPIHQTTTKATSKVKSKSKPHPHRRHLSTSSAVLPVTFKDVSGSSSIMSTSPATAEFSMITAATSAPGSGSPRSLFLRPEHEVLLGDMESLDLGNVPPIDFGVIGGRRRDDDW